VDRPDDASVGTGRIIDFLKPATISCIVSPKYGNNQIMTPDNVNKKVSHIFVIALFLLWVLPGLVGRDLWKADEPYSFGLVNHIVKTHDWVVPTLAGEPFMEKPPLFYITSAGFARLLSPWMKLHDAARMATAFYMALTALFIGLAARELLGPEHLGIAVIVLIGSTGLQETGHKLITDVAMIAGLAAALYGFALSLRRHALGGLLIGIGAGIGFLSKGLLAPGFIGVTALALPAVSGRWRTRNYVRALIIAFTAALPWFVIWPAALYLRSRELFVEWFWYENLGRFLGYSHVGRTFSPTYYAVNLPWFALPALPLALWALWRERGTWRERPDILVPLIAFLVMFVVLTFSSSIRNIYALPMLLPLALLAAVGANSLPHRAKTAINRFSIGFFGLCAAALWIGWIVSVTGFPSGLSHQLYRLQPDYTPSFHGLHFAIASIYTLLWFVLAVRSRQFSHQYLINWTAGMVLAWGLLMTLWLPWLDAGSGYGPLFTSLREKIPAGHRSIMAQGVGESERALIEYYAGVLPMRTERYGTEGCDLLLVENGREQAAFPPGTGWRIVWEQTRPMKPIEPPRERYTLFQRKSGSKTCE
jgi:4-amino-4-deoxy-L-arabinose transferase-like glycosyltransferase